MIEEKILGDILDLEQIADMFSFAIDGQLVVSYYPERVPYGVGKEVDMGEYDFPGFVYLNTGFFHKLFPKKHPKSTSQFLNLGIGRFFFNEKNHVCLVQHCPAAKHSSEHYHELEEHIACIAGSVNIRTSPAENYDNKNEILLAAGEIVRIPGKTWHYLYSDEGSITVPIKQTIKGKKDHYFHR